VGSNPTLSATIKQAPLRCLFYCGLIVQWDSKGGKADAPVTRLPAPGFRARCDVRSVKHKHGLPMAEIESHSIAE